MLSVVSAHDGETYELDEHALRGIHSLKSFEALLADLIGLAADSVIVLHRSWQVDEAVLPALLAEAREPVSTSQRSPLSRQSSLRALNGASPNRRQAALVSHTPQSSSSEPSRRAEVFVFSRDALSGDADALVQPWLVDGVVALGGTESAPAAQIQPSTLQAWLAAHDRHATVNLSNSLALLASLKEQRRALEIAVGNLEQHRASKEGAVAVFELFATPLLTYYVELLEDYAPSLAMLERIKVHPCFGSASGQVVQPKGKSRESRSLADHVSREKLESVRAACARISDDLQTRLAQLHVYLDDVSAGAQDLRHAFEQDNQDDLADCEKDAYEAAQRAQELLASMSSASDSSASALQAMADELVLLDEESRDRIRFLVERKNATSLHLIHVLQTVAHLQEIMTKTPALITSMDTDLKSRCDGFKHLARLAGIVPAYAATLFEIMRRNEYASLMSQAAKEHTTIYGEQATAERKRRQHYKTEFAGKLPWEVKSLDDNLAYLQIDFKREPATNGVKADSIAPSVTIQDLQELISVLGELETSLKLVDRQRAHPAIAPRVLLVSSLSLMSALHEGFVRGPAADSDGTLRDELARLQKELQDATMRIENLQNMSREQQEAHANQQKSIADELVSLRSVEAERVRQLRETSSEHEVMVRQLRIQHTTHDREVSALKDTVAQQAQKLRVRDSEILTLRDQIKSDAITTAARYDEQLRKYDQAQAHLARSEEQNGKLAIELAEAITVASTAKTLHAQAEAELSALANSSRQIQERLQGRDREVRQLRMDHDLERTALVEESQRYRSSAQDLSQEVEKMLHNVNAAQQRVSELEKQLANRMTSDASVIAVEHALSALRHAKRLQDAQNELLTFVRDSTTTPPASQESLIRSGELAVGTFNDTLAALSRHDPLALDRAIKERLSSAATTTRKWQKECKIYRERASRAAEQSGEKLSFRNFAKGDLALFLPTRNTVAQVWAAFNIAFPHYFLQPTGPIAEQIRTREWIVARISSLTECVVEIDEASSNRFGLSPGTKYWLIETEPWTPQPPKLARARRSTGDSAVNRSPSDAGKNPRSLTRSQNARSDPKDARMVASLIMSASPSNAEVVARPLSLTYGVELPLSIPEGSEALATVTNTANPTSADAAVSLELGSGVISAVEPTPFVAAPEDSLGPRPPMLRSVKSRSGIARSLSSRFVPTGSSPSKAASTTAIAELENTGPIHRTSSLEDARHIPASSPSAASVISSRSGRFSFGSAASPRIPGGFSLMRAGSDPASTHVKAADVLKKYSGSKKR
ncbi:uncharacterized protein L969DRAFT_73505 [Mixia osmundae IAM 14324]|uniref:Autophagy-related protein 11 n=1 Tax=Mixia osmundae (strain CBS 9802 / IAM 14324 / JCM 22182 / KY 12970) TaxID=764103 RepID=G7E8L3_MIXOS|nr:uncharacterized protein L969DRAFT_73505 [Mixia osmundae IAM 14324]KEI40115.1 hypothetical protein L969DRAFT_73505 [Mixia osmundae IAM 14324]GAA99481.1 hypothetical protein E5Q_06181 [Mixia osmundae IAM 14324]